MIFIYVMMDIGIGTGLEVKLVTNLVYSKRKILCLTITKNNLLN